jgi:hypothetical protein
MRKELVMFFLSLMFFALVFLNLRNCIEQERRECESAGDYYFRGKCF